MSTAASTFALKVFLRPYPRSIGVLFKRGATFILGSPTAAKLSTFPAPTSFLSQACTNSEKQPTTFPAQCQSLLASPSISNLGFQCCCIASHSCATIRIKAWQKRGRLKSKSLCHPGLFTTSIRKEKSNVTHLETRTCRRSSLKASRSLAEKSTKFSG